MAHWTQVQYVKIGPPSASFACPLPITVYGRAVDTEVPSDIAISLVVCGLTAENAADLTTLQDAIEAEATDNGYPAVDWTK